MKRNCMIGQSGGPTAAINASLAGVIHACFEKGFDHVYGLKNGIKGLLEETYVDLNSFKDEKNIHQLKYTPAMFLGSCRYKLPNPKDDAACFEKIFAILHQLEITDFFYIGGNDSMDTVMKLSHYAKDHGEDIHFIGVPKTIDNDLVGTDHTPGFGSAAKYVAASMLEIIYDSRIYKVKSVTIVEIMGRNAGWLTAASALARQENQTAPDLIYLPEVPFDQQQFLKDIEHLFETKHNIIVAVSEGIRDAQGHFLDETGSETTDVFGHAIHSGTGKVLEHLVSDHFGCKVRSIELNVPQRCAMHLASKTDLDEAFAIGEAAVDAALAGLSDKMMVYVRHEHPYHITMEARDVTAIANLEKRIPREWINDTGNDITLPLLDYLYPLIQGEVELTYRNGIPYYLDISHLM